MSIQAVSNAYNNPYANTLANDLQTLQNDVQAYDNAQSSGTSSDQVTLSQKALNQAMTQVQNDFASLSTKAQQAQGAQGHHHHHNHGMDSANGSGSTGTTTGLSNTVSNSYSPQSQNSVSTINLTA